MKERPQEAENERAYYQEDLAVGQVHLWKRDYVLRLKAHVAPENYYRFSHDEIIPLRQRRGERTYVHAKPYLLLPDWRMTILLHHSREASGAIGRVIATECVGMRHQELGNAQGWYYPTEQTIVLWECFLERHYHASVAPAEDPNQIVLWQGFERFLHAQFPAAQRLVTPHDDPLWERTAYQRFLQTQGYQPYTAAAFAKEVTRG